MAALHRGELPSTACDGEPRALNNAPHRARAKHATSNVLKGSPGKEERRIEQHLKDHNNHHDHQAWQQISLASITRQQQPQLPPVAFSNANNRP